MLNGVTGLPVGTAAVTWLEMLLFGLLQLIRLEADAAPFVENLVDLARTAGAFQIVYDHVKFIAQIPLSTFGVSRSRHNVFLRLYE
jgi:hypothetical protein